MIPKTPIIYTNELYRNYFEDAEGKEIKENDIARDLTEFYEMKRKQEDCGKGECFNSTNHDVARSYGAKYCCQCGADLTKGATYEA